MNKAILLEFAEIVEDTTKESKTGKSEYTALFNHKRSDEDDNRFILPRYLDIEGIDIGLKFIEVALAERDKDTDATVENNVSERRAGIKLVVSDVSDAYVPVAPKKEVSPFEENLSFMSVVELNDQSEELKGTKKKLEDCYKSAAIKDDISSNQEELYYQLKSLQAGSIGAKIEGFLRKLGF